MSSSAPAYPIAVGFLPVLHPVSGDWTLFSPLHQPEADSQDPDTKNSSKLLHTALTYLGMAAEQCLRHLVCHCATASLCWRRSWGGASGAQAHRDFGSCRAPRAPPPSTNSETAPHLHDCWRGEVLWARERNGWKNFFKGFWLSIRIHFLPASWLEKCSLCHWEIFITGL